MEKLSVPAAVSTYQTAFDNVPLQETVALPESSVQPEAFTALPGARATNEVDPFTVSASVTFALGVPLCVLTQTVVV